MNLQTYQKLNPKQKDEYKFLQEEKPKFVLANLLWGIVFAWGTIMLTLMTAYIVTREETLMQFRVNIYDYIVSLGKISIITMVYIMYCLIEFMIGFILWQRQYNKWKKENKIVEIFWWHKWLKLKKTS